MNRSGRLGVYQTSYQALGVERGHKETIDYKSSASRSVRSRHLIGCVTEAANIPG